MERYSVIVRKKLIGDFQIAEAIKAAADDASKPAIQAETIPSIAIKLNFKAPKILSKKVQLGETDVRVLSNVSLLVRFRFSCKLISQLQRRV